RSAPRCGTTTSCGSRTGSRRTSAAGARGSSPSSPRKTACSARCACSKRCNSNTAGRSACSATRPPPETGCASSLDPAGIPTMTHGPVFWRLDARGVATVTLNRPEVNNAYDAALLDGVMAAMDDLGARPGLRVVVIEGAGRHFQAGADLAWLQSVAAQSPADNVRASRLTAQAVHRLNTLPVPTVAMVQGACFGGGTGIVAACDVAIAADNAQFSIAETRWGLMAGIIVP